MSSEGVGLTLPEVLHADHESRAVDALRRYFGPLTGTGGGFTGGRFDAFDPSGTRASSGNTFTSDDVVAVSLLSVEVPPRASWTLLVERRCEFEVMLEELGPDREFADLASVDREAFGPAWRLWIELDRLPGLGPTKVSKLMARKRPKLIPIFDSVVDRAVYGGTGVQWRPLHLALRSPMPGTTPTRSLVEWLGHLRELAGLGPEVSNLRVFDILGWMEGSGYSSGGSPAPGAGDQPPSG